jgi:hypothetical protein
LEWMDGVGENTPVRAVEQTAAARRFHSAARKVAGGSRDVFPARVVRFNPDTRPG